MNQVQIKQLFEQYHKPLCNYARQIVEDIEVARDIVSDVFVQLHSSDKFKHDHRDATAYLYLSVRNKCIDYVRRLKFTRRSELSENDAYWEPSQDVESITVRKLHKVIDGLPQRMREIVTLGFIHEMSNKEIAETLGIAEMSVRNQKHTALQKIRLILKDEKKDLN